MAASQWWVIWSSNVGASPTANYFHGTQAQAQARAKLVIDSNITGPYDTKAAAQAAVKNGDSKANPPVNVSGNVNPFSGISDIGHALSGIGAFFDDAWKMATNWRMWASLGWLLLGLALIFIGGGLWLNKSLGLTSRIPLVV